MISNLIALLVLKTIIASPSCIKGENNCILCNPISKLCLQCEYDIYIPDQNGGCEKSKTCTLGLNYCNECTDKRDLCKECEEGFYPDENGGCAYTNNCEISYKGKCLKCKENYILNKNVNVCKSLNLEDFRNCEKIQTLDGTCEKCADGYYLSSGSKKCTKTQNCKEAIYEKCILCDLGFYLDKKEEKCKEQKGNLLNCKETFDGEKCNTCEDNFYFDDEGNCVSTKFCKKRGDQKNCKECISGYFLTSSGNICTNTENCYTGIKSEGICEKCKSGFYIDYRDGKCKSNQEENDLKNCVVVDDGNCIECSLQYFLGEDHKCTSIIYCAESINGTCIECKQNYYLGLDNKCSKIEHCIYSSILDCSECEDTYFYEKNSKKCIKWEKNENFTNCIYGYENKGCEKCKPDFYLNKTDKLCYDNSLNASFYKCAKTDNSGSFCETCMKDYTLITRYHSCVNISGCNIQESDNRCLECNSYRCLDVKSGLCENNNDRNKKIYYKCRRTNEEGTACEECLEGNSLNEEGFCV